MKIKISSISIIVAVLLIQSCSKKDDINPNQGIKPFYGNWNAYNINMHINIQESGVNVSKTDSSISVKYTFLDNGYGSINDNGIIDSFQYKSDINQQYLTLNMYKINKSYTYKVEQLNNSDLNFSIHYLYTQDGQNLSRKDTYFLKKQ